MYGLSQADMIQLHAVIQRFPEVKQVILFGSRAIGTYRKTSDVDLALKGNIQTQTIGSIKAALEEDTTLPYFFDVLHYDTLKDDALLQQIDEQGKCIFPFPHED